MAATFEGWTEGRVHIAEDAEHLSVVFVDLPLFDTVALLAAVRSHVTVRSDSAAPKIQDRYTLDGIISHEWTDREFRLHLHDIDHAEPVIAWAGKTLLETYGQREQSERRIRPY